MEHDARKEKVKLVVGVVEEVREGNPLEGGRDSAVGGEFRCKARL